MRLFELRNVHRVVHWGGAMKFSSPSPFLSKETEPRHQAVSGAEAEPQVSLRCLPTLQLHIPVCPAHLALISLSPSSPPEFANQTQKSKEHVPQPSEKNADWTIEKPKAYSTKHYQTNTQRKESLLIDFAVHLQKATRKPFRKMSFNFTNDLNCYSLAKSENVPTSVFDMNHYYTYRQNQGGFMSTENRTEGSFPGRASVKTEIPHGPVAAGTKRGLGPHKDNSSSAGLSSVYQASMPSRLSKLDLLIQTATSVDLDAMLARRSETQQRPTLNHLCVQAEKLEREGWREAEPCGTKQEVEQPQAPPAKKRKGSTTPTSIKLASPSANTKRQRSGPSCDCCRSRKIKCDSEIFIMAQLAADDVAAGSEPNSYIAHCEFVGVSSASGYQYYKIFKEGDHSLNNKLASFSYLQFKPCTACTTKNLKCCFSKGFTRNDIIRFNKHERQANAEGPLPTPSISSPPSTQGDVKEEESSENGLPTPSPTPLAAQLDETEITVTTAFVPPKSDMDRSKSNKKTSCKTCRSKKIKCVKMEGSSVCVHCIKKSQGCVFE